MGAIVVGGRSIRVNVGGTDVDGLISYSGADDSFSLSGLVTHAGKLTFGTTQNNQGIIDARDNLETWFYSQIIRIYVEDDSGVEQLHPRGTLRLVSFQYNPGEGVLEVDVACLLGLLRNKPFKTVSFAVLRTLRVLQTTKYLKTNFAIEAFLVAAGVPQQSIQLDSTAIGNKRGPIQFEGSIVEAVGELAIKYLNTSHIVWCDRSEIIRVTPLAVTSTPFLATPSQELLGYTALSSGSPSSRLVFSGTKKVRSASFDSGDDLSTVEYDPIDEEFVEEYEEEVPAAGFITQAQVDSGNTGGIQITETITSRVKKTTRFFRDGRLDIIEKELPEGLVFPDSITPLRLIPQYKKTTRSYFDGDRRLSREVETIEQPWSVVFTSWLSKWNGKEINGSSVFYAPNSTMIVASTATKTYRYLGGSPFSTSFFLYVPQSALIVDEVEFTIPAVNENLVPARSVTETWRRLGQWETYRKSTRLPTVKAHPDWAKLYRRRTGIDPPTAMKLALTIPNGGEEEVISRVGNATPEATEYLPIAPEEEEEFENEEEAVDPEPDEDDWESSFEDIPISAVVEVSIPTGDYAPPPAEYSVGEVTDESVLSRLAAELAVFVLGETKAHELIFGVDDRWLNRPYNPMVRVDVYESSKIRTFAVHGLTFEVSLDNGALVLGDGLWLGEADSTVSSVPSPGVIEIPSGSTPPSVGETISIAPTIAANPDTPTIPSGLEIDTTYYVVSSNPATGQIQIADSPGGSPIIFTPAPNTPSVTLVRPQPDRVVNWWTRREASIGGVAIGGLTTSRLLYVEQTYGGVAIGGYHTATANEPIVSRGGVRVGGTLSVSEDPSFGGVRVGGSASQFDREVISVGGVRLGGSASQFDREVISVGGVAVGGTQSVRDFIGSTGGVRTGGYLTVSATEVPSVGGVAIGGTSSILTREIVSVGGVATSGFCTVRDRVVSTGGIAIGGYNTASSEDTSIGGVRTGGTGFEREGSDSANWLLLLG